MRYHKIIMLINWLGLYNRSYVSHTRYKEIKYNKMAYQTNQSFLLGVFFLVLMVSSGRNGVLFLF